MKQINSNQIFKKNLRLLAKEQPLLAIQMESTDAEELHILSTPEGYPFLRRCHQETLYDYHSPSDPLKEAKEWFGSLETNGIEVLFIYGIGLGYFYQAAKTWLKADRKRHLIFLEQDPAVIKKLLETTLATELLKDPRVRIDLFRDLESDQALFSELCWTFYNSPFLFSASKLYASLNPSGTQELEWEITQGIAEKEAFIAEYLDYGVPFFRNFYPNLLDLPHSYRADGLFQKFKNVPALICGAGPSLSKQLPLLKKMRQNGLIFAGGSALNALIDAAITPHFAAAIDPNSAQLSRVQAVSAHSIPFFYRNRLYPEALQAIQGPRLYVNGAGGYEIAAWFEQKLGLEGEAPEEAVDEGNNVVNFLISIAHALGCNPLILVGVDLALTDEKYYADGVARHLQLPQNTLLLDPQAKKELISTRDWKGNPIQTLWKWQIEAEWITAFAHAHPETHLINATEGGLFLKGLEHISLEEAAVAHFNTPKEWEKEITSLISPLSLAYLEKSALIRWMTLFQASLNRSCHLIEQLLERIDALASQIRQNLPYPASLETPSTTLLEQELEAEEAYGALLHRFLQVAIRKDCRALQALQSSTCRRGLKRDNLKKLALHRSHLCFLKDAAAINSALIGRTLNQTRKITPWF